MHFSDHKRFNTEPGDHPAKRDSPDNGLVLLPHLPAVDTKEREGEGGREGGSECACVPRTSRPPALAHCHSLRNPEGVTDIAIIWYHLHDSPLTSLGSRLPITHRGLTLVHRSAPRPRKTARVTEHRNTRIQPCRTRGKTGAMTRLAIHHSRRATNRTPQRQDVDWRQRILPAHRYRREPTPPLLGRGIQHTRRLLHGIL